MGIGVVCEVGANCVESADKWPHSARYPSWHVVTGEHQKSANAAQITMGNPLGPSVGHSHCPQGDGKENTAGRMAMRIDSVHENITSLLLSPPFSTLNALILDAGLFSPVCTQ